MNEIPIAGGVVFVVLLLFLPHFRTWAASPSSLKTDTTVHVERKSFTPTLRLNGTTQAARSYVALTPILDGAQINTLVITRLVSSGAHLKKNDILVEFDPQAQLKDYLDKQNTFV